MRLVTLEDVQAAAAAIAPHVVRTPLLSFDSSLWIKPECLQPIGAFKQRGADERVVPHTFRGSRAGCSGVLER